MRAQLFVAGRETLQQHQHAQMQGLALDLQPGFEIGTFRQRVAGQKPAAVTSGEGIQARKTRRAMRRAGQFRAYRRDGKRGHVDGQPCRGCEAHGAAIDLQQGRIRAIGVERLAQVAQHLAQIAQGRVAGKVGPEHGRQADARMRPPRLGGEEGQQRASLFVSQRAGPRVALQREAAEQAQGKLRNRVYLRAHFSNFTVSQQ